MERIAAEVLAPFRLYPGCDARGLAYSVGLEVCPHAAPATIYQGTLFYDERQHVRERDHSIRRTVAAFVLKSIASPANVDALAHALGRRRSGALRRMA